MNIMIEDLIKMYKQYKKQAKERGEHDVVEYYSQTIVDLKKRQREEMTLSHISQ